MTLTLRSFLAPLLIAGGLALLCGTASAADPAVTGSRADCNGVNKQDPRACRREVGAATQALRQGDLRSADAATYEQNALTRCLRQPAQDRPACQDRVRGTGNTRIEGDVMAGGLLRQTTTIIPAGAQ